MHMSDDFAYTPPTEPWLTVVHEDRDMVVIDKPSGLLSVPGRVHADSALSRVAGDERRAYAVHRLDMDTSGLLVIALRRKAERALQQQFRERSVDKRYTAVVCGVVPDDAGEIDLPLSRLSTHPPRSVVDCAAGRPARTMYRVLTRQSDRTVLLLTPKTGRSHQLRVHLAHLGHPIVGDRFYGGLQHPNQRLHLHAQRLSVDHPFDGRRMHFESPVPF